ncbi:class I SAM-dependent DNA methyltransferase [Deinococcus sp. PEB2-63]
MQPHDFAAKWRDLAPRLTERAAYQEHWRDLCALLGERGPTDAGDPDAYAFEKHVKKAGTGETGFADVFKRGHFIAEYKAKGKSLGKALQQALLYARELDNPPLLIVSDLSIIEIHTNFTGSSPRTLRITLDDLERDAPVGGDLTALQALRAAFRDPGKLDPRQLRERVTQDATAQIGQVAQALTARGTDPIPAAHFLMRVVFAMFAEDVGLLDRGLLTRVLRRAREHPDRSHGYFQELFTAMQTGGEFWGTDVRHFNGGLFDDGAALAITQGDADQLLQAATLDWAEVEPAIFGTLFEQSLDAATRSKRGAHYTAVTDILRVTDPVVMTPLRREWAAVKVQAEALAGKRGGKRAALEALQAFHARLGEVTVLDPACGSGNFLVVTLGQLLDLEHEVRLLAFELGAGPFDLPPRVHPRQLRGIEIEPFAHELASVSVWIAYFQWKSAHGGEWDTPVLQRLPQIRHGDALLTGTEGESGETTYAETVWSPAEFIVGNPPFLGEKKQGPRLGLPYVTALRTTYHGRVAASSDLVCYWFEKARALIEAGVTRRAGLISTNSINMLGNRQVLERILATGAIFRAWPNLPWLQDGAAVRVAAVCFDDGQEQERFLGQLVGEGTPQEQAVLTPVAAIHANLSAGPDVTQAVRLPENAGLSFQGVKLAGDFDVTGEVARAWLALPNPGGVDNADVLRPLLNGDDLMDVRGDRWVIDFEARSEVEAAQYLVPFAHVVEHVKPVRLKNKDKMRSTFWWHLARPYTGMRQALAPLSRYLGTSIVAKHRAFVWCDARDLASGRLVVVASDQDWMHGVLNSRIHVLWAQRAGSTHGKANDLTYTSTTCFETFPFPEWTPETQEAVADAARFVEKAREGLRTQGFTLTGMYNALAAVDGTSSPAYTLKLAHDRLDQAVAAAYGWDWPLSEDDVLARLLALNLERSGHAS